MAGQCANLAALANNARAGSTVPSIGVGALDRPHGGYVCCNQQRLRDLSAVHEPDRYVAAGVIPEKVALTIAVEVAGFGDRPAGRGEADTSSQGDLRAIHQPDSHVAAGVAPKNVALAVAVEVPGADSRPDGGVGSSDRQRLRDLGAVHHPDRHVAGRGVLPENVALPVAVEAT